MSTPKPLLNPISFRLPLDIHEDDSLEVVKQKLVTNLRYHSSGIVDLNQALKAVNDKVNSLTKTTTITGANNTFVSGVETFNSEVGNVIFFPTLGDVNDQRGKLLYTTQQTDNGAKIIVADSSAITITLNSTVVPPYFTIIDNDSSGTANLSPSSGSLIGEQFIPANGFGIVFFDGANWWCGATGAGAGSGVTQIVAGTNVTISPPSGVGAVTVNSSGGGTINFADDETPSGLINSSNVTYTLAHTPNPAGSLELFYRGLLQAPAGIDYTLSGTTITFVSAPLTGSTLLAWYRY